MKSEPLQSTTFPRTGNLAFGARRSATHVHQGIDLPRPEGTPVFAVADGVVEHASDVWAPGFNGYGAHVVIAHQDGTRALYAHLQRTTVPKGRHVLAGELIGHVGRTTFTKDDPTRESGGPHLHLEISPRPYPQPSEAPRLDPVAWLAGAVPARAAREDADERRARGALPKEQRGPRGPL